MQDSAYRTVFCGRSPIRDLCKVAQLLYNICTMMSPIVELQGYEEWLHEEGNCSIR